jgi:DNA-binding transcriptional ArsR family regulator
MVIFEARSARRGTSMDARLEELQGNARKASTLLKAMSNEHRLMILCQLVQGERRVGELEIRIGLSQSALSQHLARLRRDGLVKTRRKAQTIYYSLAGVEARSVIEALYSLYCASASAPPPGRD